MKKAFLFSGFLCGLSLCAFAQFKPTHVPENATWFAQLDVKALRESTASALVLQLLDDAALRQLAAVHAMTGLNLTNDIDTVVLFGSGNSQSNAVLSLHGRFDLPRLTTILGMANNFQNQAIGNKSLLSWTDNDQQANLCFIDPTHAILSRDKKSIIDAVKQADKTADAINATLATALTPTTKRFCVLQLNNVADFVSDNQQLVILKDTDSLILEISPVADSNDITGSVSLKGANTEQVTQLQQILLGLQAILTMQAKENPDGAMLAQLIKVDRQDQLINLRINLSQQTLQKLVDAQVAKRKIPEAANPPPEF